MFASMVFFSGVHLNICSRGNKQMSFYDNKNNGRIRVKKKQHVLCLS